MRYLLAVLTAATAVLLACASLASAGTFLVGCETDQIAYVDPVAAPGVMSGHEHNLAGAHALTPFSTLDSAQTNGTSCDLPGDTAAYIIPTVIKDGVSYAVGPSVYYLNPGGKRQPFATGQKHLQGNPENTNPGIYAATYGCGTVTNRTTIPTSCAPGQGFRMSIYFPDCWNGKDLDNATHKTLAPCGTAGFKIKVPQLQYFYDFPAAAVGGRLSSDAPGAPAGTSGHADFWNTWDPFVLSDVVRLCVNGPDSRQCRVDVARQAVVDVAETGAPVVFRF